MEAEHDDIRRNGFFFDPQAFRLDLYRLLCVFYSSASFIKHRAAASELADLGVEFEEFEVMRLLVNVAATVRVVSDREKTFFRKLKLSCGQLVTDTATPKSKEPLTLREACNKILHATKFNFDVRFVSIPGDKYFPKQSALRPFVHLYGTKDKVNWKASLDVEAFARYNARVVLG